MKAFIETDHGTIELALDPERAPDTCENFKRYAEDGHYDGTVFHRVIPGFMIQGGGFETNLRQKSTRASIKNEAGNGLSNETGTIAMARTPDPHSATSQFFINLADNEFLDQRDQTAAGFGYCVFGKTVDGMDAVRSIAKVDTGSRGGHQDVPVEDVTIKRVRIESD